MSSSAQAGLQAILAEPRNAQVVSRFRKFFIAVIVVPIVVYALVSTSVKTLVSKGVVDNAGLASPPIVGGFAAVLALNIVTGLFALGAIREPEIVADSSSRSATTSTGEASSVSDRKND